MKCKECGKELDSDVEFCYFCGAVIDQKNLEADENTMKEDNEHEENENNDLETKRFAYEEPIDTNRDESESTVGKVIKVLSGILLVLSVIGSFIYMLVNVSIGWVILLVSVLTCLISYAIGEIVCLLTSINSKLK